MQDSLHSDIIAFRGCKLSFKGVVLERMSIQVSILYFCLYQHSQQEHWMDEYKMKRNGTQQGAGSQALLHA